MSMTISNLNQATVFKQWQVEETRGQMQTLTIELAQEDDVNEIVAMTKDAYFHKKFLPITCRNPAMAHLFVEATKKDVLRRIKAPDAYKVLVCKVTDGTAKKVVGTVYYQFKNTNYSDDTGKELPEMGLFAVHPDYTGQKKSYRIGEKLIEIFLSLAQKDKMRGAYLFAIGSHSSETGYSNSLLEYYDDKGFKFVTHKDSGPREWCATATKRHGLVVMLNDFSKSMETMIQQGDDPKDNVIIPIPKNIARKKMILQKPVQGDEPTGFSWLLSRMASVFDAIRSALCCGQRAISNPS